MARSLLFLTHNTYKPFFFDLTYFFLSTCLIPFLWLLRFPSCVVSPLSISMSSAIVSLSNRNCLRFFCHPFWFLLSYRYHYRSLRLTFFSMADEVFLGTDFFLSSLSSPHIINKKKTYCSYLVCQQPFLLFFFHLSTPLSFFPAPLVVVFTSSCSPHPPFDRRQ